MPHVPSQATQAQLPSAATQLRFTGQVQRAFAAAPDVPAPVAKQMIDLVATTQQQQKLQEIAQSLQGTNDPNALIQGIINMAAVDPQHFGGAVAAIIGSRQGLGPNERWGYDRVQVTGGRLGLDPKKTYWVNRDRVTGQPVSVIGEAGAPSVSLSQRRGMMGQRTAAQVGIEMYRPWRRIVDRGLTPDGRPTPALREVAQKLTLIEGLRSVGDKMSFGNALGMWTQVATNQGMSKEGQELIRDYWLILAAIGRQFGGAQNTPFEWFSAIRPMAPLAGDSDETLRRSITVRLADKWKTSRATASPEIFDAAFAEAFGYQPDFDADTMIEERMQQTSKVFGPQSPIEKEMEELLLRIRKKRGL